MSCSRQSSQPAAGAYCTCRHSPTCRHLYSSYAYCIAMAGSAVAWRLLTVTLLLGGVEREGAFAQLVVRSESFRVGSGAVATGTSLSTPHWTGPMEVATLKLEKSLNKEGGSTEAARLKSNRPKVKNTDKMEISPGSDRRPTPIYKKLKYMNRLLVFVCSPSSCT